MSATTQSAEIAPPQPMPGKGARRASAKPKQAAAKKPKQAAAAAKQAPAPTAQAAKQTTPAPVKQAAMPAPRLPPVRAELATPVLHPSVHAVAVTFPGEGADADEIQSWGELTLGAVRQRTKFKGPLTFTAKAA